MQIIEIKKIQSNAQLGSFSIRLRNYIASRPMVRFNRQLNAFDLGKKKVNSRKELFKISKIAKFGCEML
jgi:hypothetical protein